MALAAFDIDMPALKRKTAVSGVIEFFRQPVPGRMAAAAINKTFYFKLAGMDIFMTTVAFLIQAGKTEFAWFRFCMTLRTEDDSMFALQWQSCLVMIKRYCLPGGNAMTKRTIRCLIWTGIFKDIRAMGIFMAYLAVPVAVNKSRGSVTGTVAGNAGNRQMGTLKRVIRLLMFAEAKGAWRKTIHYMTGFAGAAGTMIGKCAPVIVAVAVVAGRKTYIAHRFARWVTGSAIHVLMFAAQRVAGQVMIESGFGLSAPCRRSMASGTLRTKTVLMRILMTVGTLLMSDRAKNHLLIIIRRMTFGAGDIQMSAGQGKICFLMIKGLDRFPLGG